MLTTTALSARLINCARSPERNVGVSVARQQRHHALRVKKPIYSLSNVQGQVLFQNPARNCAEILPTVSRVEYDQREGLHLFVLGNDEARREWPRRQEKGQKTTPSSTRGRATR